MIRRLPDRNGCVRTHRALRRDVRATSEVANRMTTEIAARSTRPFINVRSTHGLAIALPARLPQWLNTIDMNVKPHSQHGVHVPIALEDSLPLDNLDGELNAGRCCAHRSCRDHFLASSIHTGESCMAIKAEGIRSRLGMQIGEQSLTSRESQLATAIALGGRILHMDGHDDINQGQVSARMPGNTDDFLIKQVLSGFDEVTPREIVRCSMNHLDRAHPLAPPEIPLHQAIYAARGDVNAIVHTHALHSLVFGALDVELSPISHEGACFDGRYSVFKGTSHTVLTIEVGSEIAASLGTGQAVFLRNHGVVVVGKTVRDAIVLATVLERACEVQLQVLATGRSFAVSSAEDVSRKKEFIFGPMSTRAFWDYKVRKLLREHGGTDDLEWCGE
jgi:L-fuculose-phosphate aldolase